MNSNPFTPTLAGTYRWIASYSGDANNAPVAGKCNDAGENSTRDEGVPDHLDDRRSATAKLPGPSSQEHAAADRV